jgi:DNA-binding NarL/FixJ family response regulator
MCVIQAVNVSNNEYGVLIVEGDDSFRARFCSLIQTDTGLRVWGESGCAREAYKLLAYGLPALALIDLGLKHSAGSTMISRIKEELSYVRTLGLTLADDDAQFTSNMGSKPDGYICKNDEPGVFLKKINDALTGRPQVFANPELNPGRSHTQSELKSQFDMQAGEAQQPNLTPAELDILNFVARGLTGPEIANITGRSASTVPVHMKSIYRKLSVSGRAEAVFTAIKLGLIGGDTY